MMRITGGALVGRRIEPPVSSVTRPMRDRVRQALFNILAHHDWGDDIGDVLRNANVLDAFCGTGALALESLSWGARHATLFDKDRDALTIARGNAQSLGVMGQTTILAADTLLPPKASEACDLIFLAPPYRMGLIPPALIALDQAGWFSEHPLILVETAKNEELPLPDGFIKLFDRGYGETILTFIARISELPK